MNEERKLIEELKAGSYADFTKLYYLYAPRLYAFVLALSRSEDVATEIVQETFVQVWMNRKQINTACVFRSYLFSIARNRFLNVLRRRVKETFLEEVTTEIETGFADNNIEKELYLSEFITTLGEAKKKLTPRQLELFELNKEQGLSIREIAMKTSLSEQTIRNQLSQAIARLRKEMIRYYTFFLLFFF